MLFLQKPGATTFQSTLPRGSDDITPTAAGDIGLFQSTLPRGSDAINHDEMELIKISIHAPSRERLESVPYVSTSAYFNPRSLAGATFKFDIRARLAASISIHAPSRERPVTLLLIREPLLNFNPRSLAGATQGFQQSTS